MSERLWRIEHLCTMGWELYHEEARKLTKDNAKKWLNDAINEGVKPSDLRAVPDRL
tara:strand:+ start:105 stop:272 length:168 start_codon:yes stop_codon:yes gene_type:complete